MKRSRISQMSSKKRSEIRERAKLKQDFLREHGVMCEARTQNCTGCWSTQHEKKLRSAGGSPTDPSNILYVCSSCHDYIHANPAESYVAGWLVHPWEKEGSNE